MPLPSPPRWFLTGSLLLQACAPEPRPNFILVSMDTVRADRVGSLDAQGNPRTPAIDAWAREARVYRRAFSASNETLYSHASLFLGQYPTEIGDLDYSTFHVPADAPTLAARLAQAGWATEGVVAGGHLSPAFGLNAGFQQYSVMSDFGYFQETVPMALDRLEWLADQDRPFLLLAHGYDAHTPYAKPGPLFMLETPGYEGAMLDDACSPFSYENIFDNTYFPTFEPPILVTATGALFPAVQAFDALETFAGNHPEQGIRLSRRDVEFIDGAYNGAVSLVDFHVGRLLDWIDSSGIADHTYVILFSDHGEDMGVHGFYNHRVSLHDDNNQVFLAVRGPGVVPGVVEDPVSLLDVLPTVLELAGQKAQGLRGTSLLSTTPDRAIYSQAMRGTHSVRTREGRLILPMEGDPDSMVLSPPRLAWVGDDANRALPWDAPVVAGLVTALQENRP